MLPVGLGFGSRSMRLAFSGRQRLVLFSWLTVGWWGGKGGPSNPLPALASAALGLPVTLPHRDLPRPIRENPRRVLAHGLLVRLEAAVAARVPTGPAAADAFEPPGPRME